MASPGQVSLEEAKLMFLVPYQQLSGNTKAWTERVPTQRDQPVSSTARLHLMLYASFQLLFISVVRPYLDTHGLTW